MAADPRQEHVPGLVLALQLLGDHPDPVEFAAALGLALAQASDSGEVENQAAWRKAQHQPGDAVLRSFAMVGGTTFAPGVSVAAVVKRAEREYLYNNRNWQEIWLEEPPAKFFEE